MKKSITPARQGSVPTDVMLDDWQHVRARSVAAMMISTNGEWESFAHDPHSLLTPSLGFCAFELICQRVVCMNVHAQPRH